MTTVFMPPPEKRNEKMRRLLVLLLIGAFFCPAVLAATRTWKSSSGRFSTEAELLGFKDGKVKLKKADGKVVEVPLQSLSAADRRYVEKEYPEAAPGRAKHKGGAEKKKDTEKAAPQDDETEAEPEVEVDAGKEAAQDVALKVLRLEPPKRKSRGKSVALADYVLRLTQPQQFTQQDKGKGSAAEFKRLVKKEPKYVIPIPLRRVARLAGRSFCFALDAVAPNAAGYDRLYFDANGNGDLTDDPKVSATDVAKLGDNISQSQFPRVNVKLDADGKSIEYAFLLSVVCRNTGINFHTAVSLYSATAREGHITRGKRRLRVLLVDRNSNGRFDDAVSIQPNGSLAEGDLLLVNPNPRKAADGLGTDRNLVGKVLCVGKSFYRMTVAPDGGKLQLAPMQLELGGVVCPNQAYRAVLSSDDYGVVVIGGGKDQKIALAEGTWKVVNYTLDATPPGSSRRTVVEASYGNSPPAVIVKKGETAVLPFGGAFRAVVTASRTHNKVSLGLKIVGPAGEQCRNIQLNGSRPPKPRFVIKDQNDKIVHQGEFEYG